MKKILFENANHHELHNAYHTWRITQLKILRNAGKNCLPTTFLGGHCLPFMWHWAFSGQIRISFLRQKKNVHRSHYWAEPLQFWFRVQQRRWTTNWTNEELFNEYEKPMFIFKTKKHNTDSEYKKRDSSVPRISQMPQLKGISGACAILTQHFYSWKYMFERTGMTIHIVYVNVNAHTNTINRSSPTYILINYIQIQTLQYNVVQQIYFICIVN